MYITDFCNIGLAKINIAITINKYFVKSYCMHTLTQCFHSLSLLGTGFVAELTADVAECEENVVLLVNVDWQLYFNLYREV